MDYKSLSSPDLIQQCVTSKTAEAWPSPRSRVWFDSGVLAGSSFSPTRWTPMHPRLMIVNTFSRFRSNFGKFVAQFRQPAWEASQSGGDRGASPSSNRSIRSCTCAHDRAPGRDRMLHAQRTDRPSAGKEPAARRQPDGAMPAQRPRAPLRGYSNRSPHCFHRHR